MASSHFPNHTFQHFNHSHPLSIQYYDDFGDDDEDNYIVCVICGRQFTGRYTFYYCNEDGYLIHKTCGDLPQHMNHSLHSHYLTLIIRFNNPNCPTFDSFITCYYCNLPFLKYEPFYYKCDQCPNFYIHPNCATIPFLAISDDEDDKDRFLCHQKPMSLMAKNHDHKEGENCFACGSVWSNLEAYSCVENTCKNFLHKSCADKLPQTKQHPFHPQHPLTLKVSKLQPCVSCFRKDCRLVFSCVEEDKCNSNIHLCVKCVFLEKNINCQSHDHSLSLVENFASTNAHGLRCDGCRKEYKKCEEVDATQTYLFRCIECDFNLHFLCGPLPITLKYEFHMHPLTLVDHSLTKDDADEYYCDICEEKRDIQYRLYYCKSCKYNAHIHCLLQEIIKVIKAEDRNVELCALGENRWISIELGNSVDMTLNDLMNSLTPQEKELLADPLDLKNNRPLSIIYYFAGRTNSIFPREASVEDINWIQKFLQFDKVDVEMWVTSELIRIATEGLKVDEKYKRQKLIDVNGYFIPKTLVPVFNTLLVKDCNHFVGKADLRMEMKSVCATIVCAVIDEMSRANVEDITMDDLTHWFSHLFGAIEMAGFKEIISEDFFKRLVLDAYPGLKAIKITEDVSEELEAKLKLYKENQSKLAKYKCEASDFMKERMRLAQEFKGKKVGELWPHINS